jgi:type IV pilus assembly protein PilE
MNQRGFTFVELMAVMVIVLLLAALAFPSLTRHVIKARRIEGQSALLEAIQKQERFYSQHNTYVTFSADNSDADARLFKWYSGSRASASAYELKADACPGQTLRQCVEVQAIPGTARVDSAFADPGCATMALNSAGQQRATGTEEKCWP